MCRFDISEKCHFSKKCFKTSSSAPAGSAIGWRVVRALEVAGLIPGRAPWCSQWYRFLPSVNEVKTMSRGPFYNSLTIDILDNCGEIFDNLLTGHFFSLSLYFSEVAPPYEKCHASWDAQSMLPFFSCLLLSWSGSGSHPLDFTAAATFIHSSPPSEFQPHSLLSVFSIRCLFCTLFTVSRASVIWSQQNLKAVGPRSPLGGHGHIGLSFCTCLFTLWIWPCSHCESGPVHTVSLNLYTRFTFSCQLTRYLPMRGSSSIRTFFRNFKSLLV